MSASTAPFVLQGTLTVTLPGQPPTPLPFGLSGAFSSLMSERLIMSGAGTEDVSLGTIVGAKLLLLEYVAAEGAAAITLHINGSTDGLELSPGGVLLYGSPNPTIGLTALSIERTVAAEVLVHVLG